MQDNKEGKQSVRENELVIYQTSEGDVRLKVHIKQETVWLTQAQLAQLFGIDRTVVTKHLSSIFKTAELREDSVCAFFAHTANDGKTYQVQHYNLDAAVSVGYRVNSVQATKFRIWATSILRDHILKGYTINEKRLLSQAKAFKKLQETIIFIKNKSIGSELQDQAQELLSILSEYAVSLTLLHNYDEGKLQVSKLQKARVQLTYKEVQTIVQETKKVLQEKHEASELFGREFPEKLPGIIGSLYQTFGGQEVYTSIEEKAAHLLYFVIKDHPFADGNKRIGALLFIIFLQKNTYLFKESGERKITDTTLVSLALLIAMSQPSEKEVMVNLITRLLR